MIPERRKISMERAWSPRAFDSGEMEGARSMIRTGMPSFVRRRAWKRPTGPPPEIRIGIAEEVEVEEAGEEE